MDSNKDLLSIRTQELDDSTNKLAQDIIDERDIDKTKQLVDLFNLNLTKKNSVRILKLNSLLDSISDQVIERFEKRPGEFSNSDLLDYLQAVQSSIDKASKNLELVKDTPQIQINQNSQVNIQVNETLSRDEREHVTDAIKAILDRINKNKEIIEVSADENGNEPS